jgi:hypothetical protein
MRKILLYLALLIGLLMTLSSCVTSKKVHRYLVENPQEAARFCADAFDNETAFIPGETIFVIDTVEVAGAVKECPPVTDLSGNTTIAKVQCPSQKIIYKTETRVDTVREVNGARIKEVALERDQLAHQNHDLTSALKEAQAQSQSRLYTIIGLLLLMATCVLLRLFKAYIKTSIGLRP